MSLLTLIILGEGIIVICKSISKIVKNEYLWTASVVGQIVAAVAIIYFLYMLYFDRLHEEHFGSIKQQIWSFLHFPLHIVLVLVLQGVSLLIIWRQAVESINAIDTDWAPALDWIATGGETDPATPFGSYVHNVSSTYTAGTALADYLNYTCYLNVYDFVPKGVDASKELKTVATAYTDIQIGFDAYAADQKNETALDQLYTGLNSMTSATYKTLFDTFSVTVAKRKMNKGKEALFLEETVIKYVYTLTLEIPNEMFHSHV
jgi:hypothetical protein